MGGRQWWKWQRRSLAGLQLSQVINSLGLWLSLAPAVFPHLCLHSPDPQLLLGSGIHCCCLGFTPQPSRFGEDSMEPLIRGDLK